jgi:hypothetical protein
LHLVDDTTVDGPASLESPIILGEIVVQPPPFQGEEGQQPGGTSQTAAPAFQGWFPTDDVPLSSLYEMQEFETQGFENVYDSFLNATPEID